MIRIQGREVTEIYLGGAPVAALYAGGQLVWRRVEYRGDSVYAVVALLSDASALCVDGATWSAEGSVMPGAVRAVPHLRRIAPGVAENSAAGISAVDVASSESENVTHANRGVLSMPAALKLETLEGTGGGTAGQTSGIQAVMTELGEGAGMRPLFPAAGIYRGAAICGAAAESVFDGMTPLVYRVSAENAAAARNQGTAEAAAAMGTATGEVADAEKYRASASETAAAYRVKPSGAGSDSFELDCEAPVTAIAAARGTTAGMVPVTAKEHGVAIAPFQAETCATAPSKASRVWCGLCMVGAATELYEEPIPASNLDSASITELDGKNILSIDAMTIQN